MVNILYVFAAWYFRDANQLTLFYVFLISAFILSQLPQLWMIVKKKKQIV